MRIRRKKSPMSLDNYQSEKTDFLRTIINEHNRTNKYGGKVVTRFPPEPNGFLHIGHAKAICIDFGLALEYGGKCHLRMDDTDPLKEDIKYVESIQQDIKWLGFDWGDNFFFASDYFEQLYDFAVQLIKMGKAYVCSLSDEQIKEFRGTVTEPGKESPYRNRSIEENLELFEQMKMGKYKDGEHVLRAKIDMTSPNMKMRDPLLYRIRHANHYRRGDDWIIYPMYDFAHCLSDYVEGITHSICTLEFENNRELYDWILDELELTPPRPYQYEFARLNLNYTVMSKRKLLQLVEEKFVDGWDDPRLPTISGLRRRGYTPESIQNFCESIGVAKANSSVDMAQLEYMIRADLNPKVPRVLCVLDPLKVVIENYPADKIEMLEGSYYPHDVPKEGSRPLPFTKELYIERDDFMENPPANFFRLSPGGVVRLRHGYIIKCEEVIKDNEGNVTELKCSYYPNSKSGEDTSGIKTKGTIHWVSASHSKCVETRLYDRLFNVEFPEGIEDSLNPESLKIVTNAFIEPAVVEFEPGSRFQFERQGYFYYDPIFAGEGKTVFNRIVSLKDSWAKIASKDELEEIQPPKTPVKQPEQVEAVKVKPEIKEMTPEIQQRIDTYHKEYSLSEEEAMLIARDKELSAFYEKAISIHHNPTDIAKIIVNELLRELKDKQLSELKIKPEHISELVGLLDQKTISMNIAKDVFCEIIASGESPQAIVEKKGLTQIDNPAELLPIIEKVIAENPDNVEKYKSGRSNLLGFFVGQVMKATKGKANPKLLNDLVKEKLS